VTTQRYDFVPELRIRRSVQISSDIGNRRHASLDWNMEIWRYGEIEDMESVGRFIIIISLALNSLLYFSELWPCVKDVGTGFYHRRRSGIQ
jgi:hypothetical protein